MSNIESMNDPMVSVVLATYNELPQFVSKAIDSILNQTYQNIELLILDDSTNENTIATIDKYSKDKRVKLIREKTKLGFVPALNKGLTLSKGDFIARMDADDISELNRFELQVEYLKANPGISVIGGQMDLIDEEDNVISHREYPLNGISFWLFSLVRDPLAHPTVMLRREIVDQGFRYNEEMKRAEDIDLWLRILNSGYKIANIPETILKFRVERNFNEKRVNKLQKQYVYRARFNNLSIKRPIFSVFSILCSTLFRFAPNGILTKLYNKENGGNQP